MTQDLKKYEAVRSNTKSPVLESSRPQEQVSAEIEDAMPTSAVADDVSAQAPAGTPLNEPLDICPAPSVTTAELQSRQRSKKARRQRATDSDIAVMRRRDSLMPT
jgi:hypothetical protein